MVRRIVSSALNHPFNAVIFWRERPSSAPQCVLRSSPVAASPPTMPTVVDSIRSLSESLSRYLELEAALPLPRRLAPNM